jgi:hypothetical protein
MALFARALDLGDRAVISNTGSFLVEDAGIFTTGAGKVEIDNRGLISGVLFGVTKTMTTFSSFGTQVSIVNSGTISGADGSVFTGAAVDRVTNSGLLQGNVSRGDCSDILTHRGTINGAVFLGLGDDYVDTRTGVINGQINLEDGEDTFIRNALVRKGVGRELPPLNCEMRHQNWTKFLGQPENPWRALLQARPKLFTRDPRDPNAMVRLR